MTAAFAFFKGACARGIYDNMKTAVETLFAGKNRLFNRRFVQMCSHYLIEPVACTPAAGWEKGQVKNQVGLARQRFFTPRAASTASMKCKRQSRRPASYASTTTDIRSMPGSAVSRMPAASLHATTSAPIISSVPSALSLLSTSG
jgi:transposase